MRKQRRTGKLCALLAVTLCASCAFTACEFGAKSDENATKSNVIFSFDSYDILHSLSIQNFQGRMSVCTDEDMVTQGAASMKLTVVKPSTYEWHRYSEWKDYRAPRLTLPLEETELSKTAAFTLDTYNDNDYDTGMYLFATDVEDNIVYSAYDTAYAKTWTKLSFSVNQAFVSEKIYKIYLSIADTNENTTYYFDNFQAHAGTSAPITAKAKGNVLSSLSTMEELYSLNVFTTTHSPAFHAAIQTDPNDAQKKVLALVHENYSGAENSVSYTSDGRIYGIRLAPSVTENYDFSAMRYCSVEVFNAMSTPKKVTIALSNDSDTDVCEVEIPVGEWTKISVENTLGSAVKEISVTMRCYDNFSQGTVYLRNLLAEGENHEN